MVSYKNFAQQFIGASDIASLTLRSGKQVASLNFGTDGCYNAYICYGDDVEIGGHYTRVFDGCAWLKVYDDMGVTYHEGPELYNFVTVYRAGEMGCIIHWHN